jgi:twitching motility protein PilT
MAQSANSGGILGTLGASSNLCLLSSMVSPPPPPSLSSEFTLDTLEVPAFKGSISPNSVRANETTLPPGQPTVRDLITEAFENGYSDVHLGVGEVPRFRNRGEIQTTDFPETDRLTFQCWLQELLTDEEIRQFETTLDFDGATQYDFARVRINVFDTLHGPAMVMRLIPLTIMTIEQLRLPKIFQDVCHYHKGLILVTGPTGSGKSTTWQPWWTTSTKKCPATL